MTKEELQIGFGRLGGKTERNGVLLTIVKYSKEGREAVWKGVVTRGHHNNLHFPVDANCGCCAIWRTTKRKCKKGCPLNTCWLNCLKHHKWFSISNPYKQVVSGDRYLFDHGCNRIIAACNRWLKKHPKDSG